MEKTPTKAFSLLKAPTMLKRLHNAKWELTHVIVKPMDRLQHYTKQKPLIKAAQDSFSILKWEVASFSILLSKSEFEYMWDTAAAAHGLTTFGLPFAFNLIDTEMSVES